MTADNVRAETPSQVPWFERLQTWCTAFARFIAAISVAIMLALSVLTLVETVTRSFFYVTIPGFFEFAAFSLAVGILACFPASVMERSHLTIDFISQLMSPRLRAGLALVGGVLLLVFLALLGWRLGDYAATLASRGQLMSSMGIPLASFFWAASLAVLICVPLQIVVLLAEMSDLRAGREVSPAAAVSDFVEPSAPGGARPKVRITGFGLVMAALALLALAAVFGGGNPLAAIYALARNPALLGAVLFFAVWVPIVLLVPLGAAMGLTGILGLALVVGTTPAFNALGFVNARFLSNPNLATLPLFLMMGNFAVAAGLANDVYALANILLRRWKGGLAHATIIGCAGFGAVTGSSVACAAAMGAIALPQMRARHYSPQLAGGCVAAGGTLGQLIPPSTIVVLYAFLTEVSIGRMLIAVLVPGIITMVAFLITTSVYVRLVPGAAPAPESGERPPLLPAFKRCWAVAALFGLVIGGLYTGIFTANEAAAVGAAMSFFFALGRGKLGGGAFWRVMGETASMTAMLFLIIIGAITFAFFMGTTQFADQATQMILGWQLPPLGVVAVLIVVYLLLGTAMESATIMLITTPIVAPVIEQLGFDLIWWGIVMVMVVEAGIISPPYGINMFIIQTLQPDITLPQVFRGVMPYFFATLVVILLLILVPELVLWLPSQMFR
jgi:tripartite ATP-independent transporter DctM subunit